MLDNNTTTLSSGSALDKIKNNKRKEEELCFDRNEFMKENFSIDEFLHKNRSVPSLEMLRDHLGIYLKGLRASMIDLINEDYAEFVSLSANLVGLDQSIDTIKKPLEQFRNEIHSIKELIDENQRGIRSHLEEKQELRELQRDMQSLKEVYKTLAKLEDIFERQLSGDELEAIVYLERAALQLIQLKFNEKFCTQYLSSEQKNKILQLNTKLLEKLRTYFNSALKTATSKCSDNLERVLRIYLTLNASDIAELAFKEDCVAPYMSRIISEHSLQNSHQGLAGIYSKILDFISLNMTDLLRLTHYTDKICGLQFLLNSFWSDVEMRLETHMTSIFAPGNSEIFYSKYKCTRDFLKKIEELLATETAIQNFREHKQTKSFQSRWNLPVYFQICFQEIAGNFESTLEPLLCDNIFDAEKSRNKFQLLPFNMAYKSIERCWEEGVFLFEVFPKFYKLTLQIIIRLIRWIKDLLQLICGSKKSHLEHDKKFNKIKLLIALYLDIQTFIAHLCEIQTIIMTTILEHKRDEEETIITATIDKSLSDLKCNFNEHLLKIQTFLANILITESGAENIRQINDIPRLYRKTNREIPNRCSLYIEQMLRPLKAFAQQQQQIPKLGDAIANEVLKQVFSRITADYYTAVTDVLTSVQKTEESLRRLRNLKAGPTTATAAHAPSSTKTLVSDDDKIRLQLRVDVIAWTSELAKLGFMPTEVDKLLDLNNIVEESIKIKDAQN